MRNQDERFEGRRRQDRGQTPGAGRGGFAREESERRGRIDDRRYEEDPWAPREQHYEDEPWASRERRYEDEPWASRERGSWRDERQGQRNEGTARYAGDRERWPRDDRGDFGQGNYWQSEGARRGQGGFGPGSYYQGGGQGDYSRARPSGQDAYGRAEFGREHRQGDFETRGWTPEDQRSGYFGHDMREGWRGGPHAGRGPKGYQRSDERIKEDVCERLTQHGEIDATEVEIKVSNREITLTGTVPTRQAKRLAEDVAEAITGVTEVHNQLRIAPEPRHEGQQTQANSGAKGRDGQTRAA